MHIIEIILNREIKEADLKINLYQGMGWNTEWPDFFRHLLLEGLLKYQLKHFIK